MKQLKLDLHVHTCYSQDGIDHPKLVLQTATTRGLGAIAITDHNTVKGLEQARKCRSNVLVIPGIEVDTKEGHIIGLGVDQAIKPWRTAAETIETIRDAGGIVVVPHPFDFLRRGIGLRMKALKTDAIEVMNSRTNTPFSNALARRSAKNMNSPVTAGSDAHIAEEVGSSYIVIEDKENLSVDTILKTITSMQCNQPKVVGKITPLRSRVKKIALQRLKRKYH
nr:PHP domain-containing protein [Candidatus Njordarchaeum guaymaensis]